MYDALMIFLAIGVVWCLLCVIVYFYLNGDI